MKYVREMRLPGSFTLEAAGVMAMVFFSVSAVMGQAGKLHDETAGSMVLHEAVEKARHERDADPREVGQVCGEYLGLLLSFPSYDISLEKEAETYVGQGKGGKWSRSIEIDAFRPEQFLRRITLLEGLGEMYGD